MNKQSFSANKVVHFEIPADDLDRAKKFYQSIFGWKIIDYPEMQYTIVQTVDVDLGKSRFFQTASW